MFHGARLDFEANLNVSALSATGLYSCLDFLSFVKVVSGGGLDEILTRISMGDISTPVIEELPPGTVLIAGGGPVGLLLSAVLSRYRIKSVLFERNKSTTKWPKMDLTNPRSMEILRRLGLADELRKQGVRADIPQPVLFSTGMPAPEAITRWEHESVSKVPTLSS